MCQGYSRCADGSDVQTCNQNFTCAKGLDGWQKNNLETGLVHGHTYCTYNDDDNNRMYDSISRQDESDLNIVSSFGSINFDDLKSCNAGRQCTGRSVQKSGTGLLCGSSCVYNYRWCQSWSPKLCKLGDVQFSRNDVHLCANSTVWKDKSCNNTINNEVIQVGKRCSGKWQQCIYPWYLSKHFYYEEGLIILIWMCYQKIY